MGYPRRRPLSGSRPASAPPICALTHGIGRVALSGRIDLFDTRQTRRRKWRRTTSEQGWSLTAAVRLAADRPGAIDPRGPARRKRARRARSRLGLGRRPGPGRRPGRRCGLRSESIRLPASSPSSVRIGGTMRALAFSALLLAAPPGRGGRSRRPGPDGERRRRCRMPSSRSIRAGGRRRSAGRRRFQIAQRDLQFSPFVLVVPVGAQVSFPNFDNVRHHVYSFSPARALRAQALCPRAGAQRAVRPAGNRAAGLQHPRRDDRLHQRRRHRPSRREPTPSGRVSFAGVPAGAGDRARLASLSAGAGQPARSCAGRSPPAGRADQAVPVNLRPPPRPGRTY